ncbi:MAG TPA: DMT family transporter, partial [Candidatus Paceibacterota bacterium]|nr:DMT family transporter [Candidatus Paceibacterota bacterium]
ATIFMIKLLLILLVGLTFESAGVVLLKKGMDGIGDMEKVSVSEVLRVVKAGVTSPQILLGVFFEALFFGCLLMLMSKSDISFLWPLTALSFVFATFAAIWFLHEHVSPARWIGVILIMIGAGFISYSEKSGEHAKKTPAAQTSSPAAPQSSH